MISRLLLITSCATACAIVETASAQTPVPGQIDHSTREVDTSLNHPVEPKVADRSALTMPGRSMPYELAMPQGFDRVYAVPGKAGMFYRASGALYVVFSQGEYKQVKKGSEYAMVPSGAVFYIGKPDWSKIIRISDVAAGSINSQQEIRNRGQFVSNPAAIATKIEGKINAEIDPANAAIDAKRDLAVHVPLGGKLPVVSGNDVGFGGGSARPNSATDSIADPKSAEFSSKAPDTAAWAGTLPHGVDRSFLVGDGASVRPRILVDFIYRQERLSQLFLRANNSSRQR